MWRGTLLRVALSFIQDQPDVSTVGPKAYHPSFDDDQLMKL